MARLELSKLRSPIGEVGSFVAASGTRTAGTPVVVNDCLVYPLETTTSAAGVVAYEIPKVLVTKNVSETWATGDKIYFFLGGVEFSNNPTDSNQTPVGICVEVPTTSAEGLIHFIGYQVPASTLDTNPSQ